MNKINYQTMLPHELAETIRQAPVAYLALGTLEYHGPHMAVGNDALKAEAILERVCELTGGVLLPTLYWGIGGGHKTYQTSILVRDEVLSWLLDDILEGAYRNGFRIFLLLTGHYPGEQVGAVKEAANRLISNHPEVMIWALPEHEAYPGEFRGDHAAKWETSILQYLYPQLVEIDLLTGADADDAPAGTKTLEEMNAPGPLQGILGENPAKTASPLLGEETVTVIIDQIVRWVTNSLSEFDRR